MKRPLRRLRPLLGTYVEIGALPSASASEAVEAAYRALEDLQGKLSFQDADSELSRLNRSHGAWLPLSPRTLCVLRLARAVMRSSGGLFDCTLGGALVRLGALPRHGGPEFLEHGVAEDLELAPGAARLRRPLRLTLDGIAKGYAVDVAVAALRRRGVAAGWVNAGGDLRVFGALTLPVQRREADGSLRPLGGLREAALASSAVSAQDPARFPARILAANGREAAPGCWSVIARSAWRADALTKVAALLPSARRAEALARLGGRLVAPVPREGAA